MKNQIKLLAFIALALLSVNSYSQSSNSITITPAITAQSNAFKNLAGQNRLTEFKALQALLVTISSKANCEGIPSTNFTNRVELYNLLGTPSNLLSANLVAYKLNPNAPACQAVIGIDDTGVLLFSRIDKCP